MICKRCGKNNAEIYYKQTVNGHTDEYALCSKCAEELKKEGKLNMNMPFSFDDFGFGWANDGIFGLKELFGLPFDSKYAKLGDKKKCSLCSSTFDDLVKRGKVGCAKCYETFSEELKNSVERIHGKTKYAGRIPKKHISDKDIKEDRINSLHDELKKAIDDQEFEKAAVIRDKIREIENNEKQK